MNLVMKNGEFFAEVAHYVAAVGAWSAVEIGPFSSEKAAIEAGQASIDEMRKRGIEVRCRGIERLNY